ncbi:MAG: DoxX family protein [Brevibacterium linens]
MAPLVFLLATTIVTRILGLLGLPRLRPWPVAIRTGVGVMFLVTGASHFVGMRAELISMVPPALPAPALLVTVTGVLELAGAIGLFWAPTRLWAASGLSLMLIAMFPANVYKALNETGLSWDDTLAPRTLLQAIFLAATSAIVVWGLRDRTRHLAARGD